MLANILRRERQRQAEGHLPGWNGARSSELKLAGWLVWLLRVERLFMHAVAPWPGYAQGTHRQATPCSLCAGAPDIRSEEEQEAAAEAEEAAWAKASWVSLFGFGGGACLNGTCTVMVAAAACGRKWLAALIISF